VLIVEVEYFASFVVVVVVVVVVFARYCTYVERISNSKERRHS